MPDSDTCLSENSGYLRAGTLIVIVATVGGFVADYLFNLTLSNLLPSHEYGDYKVAYAFAVLTSTLVLLGGDRVAPRVLSGPIAKGDVSPVWRFLRFYLSIAFGLSGVVILTTTLFALFHLGTTDIQDHHPIFLISLVIPLIAIGALLSRILQSAKLLALSNLPWRIALPLLKILFLFFLFLAVSKLELWHVILSGALSVALIVSWQWRQLKIRNLVARERHAPLAYRELLALSIPMMLAVLITLALNQIDLFMLEILGTEAGVGHFAAAATTAHILSIAQVSTASLFLPLIAPAMERGAGAAKALYRQAQTRIAVVTLLLLVLLMGLGSRLLSLFGGEFQRADPALQYLSFGYALWALAAFSSTWLQYSNGGLYVVVVGGITLATDALLNLWLIPLYDIEGAAIATAATLAIATVLIWIGQLRYGLLPARALTKHPHSGEQS